MPFALSTFFAPVRPFDASIIEDYSMYDHMPYVRDMDVCGNDKAGESTGNVFKYFRYQLTEPRIIENKDDIILYKIKGQMKHIPSKVSDSSFLDTDEFVEDTYYE